MALTECPHCKAGHVCHVAAGQRHYPLDRLEDEIRESHGQVMHAIHVREDAGRGSTGGIHKMTLFDRLTRLQALIEAHALTAGYYPTRLDLADIRKYGRDTFGVDLLAMNERVKAA